MSDIGSGYFVRLNKTEQEKIENFLQANNYEISGDGIKKFFMDFIEGDLTNAPEDSENPFIKTLKDNPEMVAGAANVVSGAFKTFLKKKVGL